MKLEIGRPLYLTLVMLATGERHLYSNEAQTRYGFGKSSLQSAYRSLLTTGEHLQTVNQRTAFVDPLFAEWICQL